YKTKMKRSSRKLDSFFGEITPIDVCISEIRKEGVKAMLESKVPLCYFLHFLLSEYSSENLFFYLEVEQYETMQFLTIAEQKALAQQIFDQYVSDDADFEINLEDKV
ncbi:hypothetical protein BDF20DRAFT_800590, partial [Mycotypha africana]|uniref:uncharacterized protein n=1 Tax=Mycotypha africana TaxID=64632 RepID=UPI00230164C0